MCVCVCVCVCVDQVYIFLFMNLIFQSIVKKRLNVWHVGIWLYQALVCCRKEYIIFQLQPKKMSLGGKFWTLVVINFTRVVLQQISRINGGTWRPNSVRQLREDWPNYLEHQMKKVILLFHSLVDYYILIGYFILYFETFFGSRWVSGVEDCSSFSIYNLNVLEI